MDADNRLKVHHRKSEPWKVTLVDTGDLTQTGGCRGRVRDYLGGETFCFTYGDGVADVDISSLVAHHRAAGVQATTAVQPPGRYGACISMATSLVSFSKSLMVTMPGLMVAFLFLSLHCWI